MNPNRFLDPTLFPPQAPPANERVAEYVEIATAASTRVIEGCEPRRFSYGPSTAHQLDVFDPRPGVSPKPALIFFHGGAWTAGYPWWSSFMAPGVADAGSILVAPTYRLGPAHRFPAQLDDVAAAIAWVWTKADTLGIDRSQLAVGGHSAGGHLAALATLHPDALPAAGVSRSIIGACLPVSSSFNLHYPDAQPGSGEERVYKTLLARPEDDGPASPINFVSDEPLPPFHIVIGGDDFDRIKRTSVDMAAAMRARSHGVTIDEWKGKDHFDTHLALIDPQHEWYGRLRDVFASTPLEQVRC